MKQCIKCNINKSLEDFPKSRSSRDGKHSYCKKCMVEQRMNRYEYKKKKMLITDTHKQCRICEELLPISEFNKISKESKKIETYCKKCRSYMGHERVLSRYKMNIEQYLFLLKQQDYKCKICGGTENKRLSVDHDHNCCPGQYTCGKCTRGLLCSKCNKTLGLVNDNIDTLKSMIDYLQNF